MTAHWKEERREINRGQRKQRKIKQDSKGHLKTQASCGWTWASPDHSTVPHFWGERPKQTAGMESKRKRSAATLAVRAAGCRMGTAYGDQTGGTRTAGSEPSRQRPIQTPPRVSLLCWNEAMVTIFQWRSAELSSFITILNPIYGPISDSLDL